MAQFIFEQRWKDELIILVATVLLNKPDKIIITSPHQQTTTSSYHHIITSTNQQINILTIQSFSKELQKKVFRVCRFRFFGYFCTQSFKKYEKNSTHNPIFPISLYRYLRSGTGKRDLLQPQITRSPHHRWQSLPSGQFDLRAQNVPARNIFACAKPEK